VVVVVADLLELTLQNICEYHYIRIVNIADCKERPRKMRSLVYTYNNFHVLAIVSYSNR